MEKIGIPASIVLIYGIPASGKTTLTSYLVDDSNKPEDFTNKSWIGVHFDDFYPLDLRAGREKPSDENKEGDEGQFAIKEARHQVNECLEYFIAINHLGRQWDPFCQLEAPYGWKNFLMSLKGKCSRMLDESGRLAKVYQKPIVLLLDDNMFLRSIRHEYYKMARKYQLGFMEVCIQCSVSSAAKRNSQRSIPIPYSTIIHMEKSLEVPTPSTYIWETNNVILFNDGSNDDFMQHAKDSILPMLDHSLANPVHCVLKDDFVKEASRKANLDNYVHQADCILRLCVSEVLESITTATTKTVMAKKANMVRRNLLDELKREGKIQGVSIDKDMALHNQYMFKRVINNAFVATFDETSKML